MCNKHRLRGQACQLGAGRLQGWTLGSDEQMQLVVRAGKRFPGKGLRNHRDGWGWSRGRETTDEKLTDNPGWEGGVSSVHEHPIPL